jgi:CheY-like chemotaxis protein
MASQASRKKVLIVDNNDLALGTLQRLLEDAGFDTRTTWSGHEALALLQSKEFDVLLVDDYLPDLHANDFLERIVRLAIQPWVVVMRGGAPTPAQLRRYTSLGASAVVDKNDSGQIRRAVSSCCVEEPLAKMKAN